MPVKLKTTYPNIWDKVSGSSTPEEANISAAEWNALVKAVDDSRAETYVQLGENVTRTRTDSVLIGANTDDTLYPGATEGSGRVAIGEGAKSGAWRATAIGALSIASAVSATALGYAVVADKVHAVALGRGAYGNIQNGVFLGSFSNQDVWVGNGQGHQYDQSENGIDIGSTETPENRTVTIHGQDAYDWRATPSSFDKKGGNLALAGGRGTGNNSTNGGGGKVIFQVGKFNGQASGNTQHTLVDVGEFDAERSASFNTNFLLRDLTTNTMKRVMFGDDDSAGTGFKTLKVAN